MGRYKVILLLMLICCCKISAQEAGKISSTGPLNQQELLTFVDQWIAKNQKANGTPAISISMVQHGKVQISKGYGVTNLVNAKAANKNSVFRIASVSKIFVGIAAAQLAEKGQLDMDRDINDYLDNFNIDNPFVLPVTVKHLLSHTAGFDEQMWSDLTLQQSEQQSLGEHLSIMLPPIVNPPGKMIAYSNYGYALAAYIIEKITDMSFDQFVQQNILQPLQMDSSSYQLNDIIKPKLVRGYKGNGEEITERPYTYVHRYPSTSMMTSAQDMTRLMNVILNKGKFNNVQIYGAQADQLITTALYSADPFMPGQTAGFMQWNRWGHQIIWHDGGHVGFSAELILFPKLNSGFFITANNKDANLASRLKHALLNRYYKPSSLHKIQAPFEQITDHSKLYGEYVNSRRAHNNVTKIFSLFSLPLEISAGENGLINALGASFAEESVDLFSNVERPDMKLKVVRNKNNQIDYIAVDYNGAPRSYEKLTGIDNLSLHRTIWLIILVIFIFLATTWLVASLRNNTQGDFYVAIKHAALPSVFNLLFCISFIVLFTTIDRMRFRMGEMVEMWLVMSIPLLTLAIFTWSSYKAIRLFTQKSTGRLISSILITGILVNLIFYIELIYWNLLGFNFTS